MYTLPSKLKFFAIILMVIGALGIVTGFLSTPSNTEEVKEMLASSHDDGHQTEALIRKVMQNSLIMKIHIMMIVIMSMFYINYKIDLGPHCILLAFCFS